MLAPHYLMGNTVRNVSSWEPRLPRPLVVFLTCFSLCIQDIFDLIFRELRLGALSLTHISATPDTAIPDASRRARSKVGFDFPDRSSAGMFVPAEGVQPEMRRSYSHGSCLPGIDKRTSNIRKGAHVSGGSTGEEDNAAVSDLGLLALEIGDVEPHVYGQLALLCSLRNYAIARVQLAHPSALRSILCLLKVGSPRVQR